MIGIWTQCDDNDRPILVSNGSKIVGANELALVLFGATADDMIGSDVRLWVYRKEWQVVEDRLKFLTEHENVDELPEINYTFVRRNGSLFYAALKVKRIEPGIICGRYRFIADIEEEY
jgi:PAS domain S-box-containing protein